MYEIGLNTIRFTNGKRHEFSTSIAESLDFEESIVIRLEASHQANAQNVLAFDYFGKLLWKIPQPQCYDARHAYVGIFRKGSFVEVLNWDGHLLTLHAEKGMILAENFYNGSTNTPRRTASVRRCI